MNKFAKLQKELKPYSKFIERYSNIIYETFMNENEFDDFPLEENIIIEAINK